MGYMGSGKSTIGKDLAKALGYSFTDLDNYIEDKQGQSISEIFKTKGEIYFRKKETEYLQELIENRDKCVIALGGGTPCYSTNLNLLLKNINVKTIYFKLSISSLVNRLFKEKENRPLISHLKLKEDLTEFIGKHLFERSEYYSQAELTISADGKSVQELVEAITLQLV